MKASVLCVYDEGSVVNTPLIGAKGLSLLIDVDDQRTLFDTGLRGRYLMHNLSHLDIPAESITRVVLSHGHKDHIGGLDSFLEDRKTPIPVLANADCLGIVERNRIIGEENAPKAVTEKLGGWTQLSDHLFSLELPQTEFRRNAFGSAETVRETAMVLMTRSGPVLITGCAHTGIRNAIETVRKATGKDVQTVVGGIHLVRRKNPELESIASYLIHDIKTPLLYLNHCVTPKSKTQLRIKLGLKGARDLYAGSEVVFEV